MDIILISPSPDTLIPYGNLFSAASSRLKEDCIFSSRLSFKLIVTQCYTSLGLNETNLGRPKWASMLKALLQDAPEKSTAVFYVSFRRDSCARLLRNKTTPANLTKTNFTKKIGPASAISDISEVCFNWSPRVHFLHESH
jgi:hypothetical protein